MSSFVRLFNIESTSCALSSNLLNNSIPLSDVLPILENMGLRVVGEEPFEVTLEGNAVAWINDFNMYYSMDTPLVIEEIKDIFQEAFRRTWYGRSTPVFLFSK